MSTRQFSENDISEVLKQLWDEMIPSGTSSTDPFSDGMAMDSLTAVEILVEIQSTFELPELPLSIIKKGGYKDKEEFVSDFIQNVKKQIDTSK